MLAPELTPDELVEPDPLHHARSECEQCGGPVLAVVVNGELALVDVAEVLPIAPCPFCAAVLCRGHERLACSHCRLSGVIGEPLPLRGVVISEDGRARVWTRRYDSKVRRRGDAIHRHHACILL